MGSKTLVADNGAFQLRLGFANEQLPSIIMPNQCALIRNDVSARELVGEETEETHYLHRTLEYKRAHQRGCLLDKQVEEKVWTRALTRLGADFDFEDLITTESPLVPNTCKRLADELFFEHFNFKRVARVLPQTCVAVDYSHVAATTEAQVRIVVDCGYSATWVVPLLGCNAIWPQSMRRIDLGGKALTNLYKEELSWRHVNVMDDTKLAEDCKVKTCFVRQLAPHAAALDRHELYLLPDFKTDFYGRLLAPGEALPSARQVMRLSALERMNIPEILFHPMRIGLREMGLAQTVQECINSLPFECRAQARRNILVTGGSANFPGFCTRLEHELDERVVDWSKEYLHSAWRGAARLATQNKDRFEQIYSQTKQQYEEEGSSKQRRKREPQAATAPIWYE